LSCKVYVISGHWSWQHYRCSRLLHGLYGGFPSFGMVFNYGSEEDDLEAATNGFGGAGQDTVSQVQLLFVLICSWICRKGVQNRLHASWVQCGRHHIQEQVRHCQVPWWRIEEWWLDSRFRHKAWLALFLQSPERQWRFHFRSWRLRGWEFIGNRTMRLHQQLWSHEMHCSRISSYKTWQGWAIHLGMWSTEWWSWRDKLDITWTKPQALVPLLVLCSECFPDSFVCTSTSCLLAWPCAKQISEQWRLESIQRVLVIVGTRSCKTPFRLEKKIKLRNVSQIRSIITLQIMRRQADHQTSLWELDFPLPYQLDTI